MKQLYRKPRRGIIHLEVRSGLCNRLRSLVSGICLAEDLNSFLVVYWPSSKKSCQAAFSDLYELSSLPRWVMIIDRSYSRNSVDGMKVIECRSQEEALTAAAGKHLISSNTYFHSSDITRRRRHLQQLLPKQFLLARVWVNHQKLPKGLIPVGVHVRRTDNIGAIEQSPLSGFESAMQKITNAYFFVASDDEQAAGYLMRKFPGRTYCQETVRKRDSVEGIQEALVSLYTLALCSRILGSYYSSFSTMSGELRFVEVITILKTT